MRDVMSFITLRSLDQERQGDNYFTSLGLWAPFNTLLNQILLSIVKSLNPIVLSYMTHLNFSFAFMLGYRSYKSVQIG